MNFFWSIVTVLVIAFIYRLYVSLPCFSKKKIMKKENIKVMCVLGSGGHTGEMMPLIDALHKADHYKPITFVCADSDKLSFLHPLIPEGSVKKTIPRARNVGQSFSSSIFTTINSFFASLSLISEKPDLLLVNGPGVCLPVVLAMFLGNVLGLTHCSIVFVESICRVNTLSLTGKLIYPLCDLFFVYWESLLPLKKRAQLIDLFGLNHKKSQ